MPVLCERKNKWRANRIWAILTAMSRIAQRFTELKKQDRTGLVTFITAGDPDLETSQAILNDLPRHGADIIEIGMPFSDPMADGPAIQLASQRALKAGATLKKTLQMVESFRVTDPQTPIVLMGYFNPIYAYGTERFALDAKESGVDGLIIVDLPPEEDHELRAPAADAGLDLIRLITPTTDEARLGTILEGASGFLYYVSIAGVTGTAKADAAQLRPRLEQIRKRTALPIAVGFGIKTPQDAASLHRVADAVVVGSAIVNTIAGIQTGSKTIHDVNEQVKALSAAL